MWFSTCTGMTMLLFLYTATCHAADYTFNPDNCDFRMTFPEEPGTTDRCNPEKPDQCYKVSIFNKIFTLDSGIKVTVTCNPAEDNMLQRYSGDVMKYTLKTMMGGGDTADEQIGFDDYGDAKAATLLGQRTMPDKTDKIYMAQLWISEKSVLTVEGELTGPASDAGDAMFTSIMKSVRPKDWDDKKDDGKPEEEKPASE